MEGSANSTPEKRLTSNDTLEKPAKPKMLWSTRGPAPAKRDGAATGGKPEIKRPVLNRASLNPTTRDSKSAQPANDPPSVPPTRPLTLRRPAFMRKTTPTASSVIPPESPVTENPKSMDDSLNLESPAVVAAKPISLKRSNSNQSEANGQKPKRVLRLGSTGSVKRRDSSVNNRGV